MLMKLSLKQIFGLIKETNAFTRCVGFLYIRYLCKPELLWHFLSPYMMDDQEFVPTPATEEKITIGEYVERLLVDQNYYSTILPRIPVLIDKEIQKRLLLIPEKRQRRKENLEHLHDFKIGKQCYVLDQSSGTWDKAYISGVDAHDGVTVVYYTEDGDATKAYDLSEVLPCLDQQDEYDEEYEDDKHYDYRSSKDHGYRERRRDSRSSSSDSRDGRRRKRHRDDKKHRRRRSSSREKRREYEKSRKPALETRDLEDEVRRIRMGQASSSTRAGYSIKASSYKTTLSLAMPVGIKKRDSRSPTPERKFVRIENKAKDRKYEKVLKVDDHNDLDKQNQQQNERLERLKRLYQS